MAKKKTSKHKNTVQDPCLNLNDPDINYYSTEILSSIVENEIEKEKYLKPKPATSTTSFWTMIAASIAGVIVMFLVSKGIITEEDSAVATSIIEPVLITVIGWIIATYIKGRNEVSKVKAASAANQELKKLEIKQLEIQREMRAISG